MARIQAQESRQPLTSDLVSAIMDRRNGKLTALDYLLLHNESVAKGWNEMFGALAAEKALDLRIREIAVLRVAYLTRAQYPLHQHRRIARAAGLTEAEIEDIRDWRNSALFDLRDQATLAYVDAMTLTVQVPESIFIAMAAFFDESQIIVLTATIGAYNMAARFMEALELLPDESAAHNIVKGDGGTR